jgi:hypothetical protein
MLKSSATVGNRRATAGATSAVDGLRSHGEARRQWQRDYRRRLARGEAIAPAPFDAAVIDFLVRTRWLDPALAEDRREIGRAMFAALRDAARG